jgi:hypothetical protein
VDPITVTSIEHRQAGNNSGDVRSPLLGADAHDNDKGSDGYDQDLRLLTDHDAKQRQRPRTLWVSSVYCKGDHGSSMVKMG